MCNLCVIFIIEKAKPICISRFKKVYSFLVMYCNKTYLLSIDWLINHNKTNKFLDMIFHFTINLVRSYN